MKSKKILIALVVVVILGYLYLNMNVRHEGMEAKSGHPMPASPSPVNVGKSRMKKNN